MSAAVSATQDSHGQRGRGMQARHHEVLPSSADHTPDWLPLALALGDAAAMGQWHMGHQMKSAVEASQAKRKMDNARLP